MSKKRKFPLSMTKISAFFRSLWYNSSWINTTTIRISSSSYSIFPLIICIIKQIQMANHANLPISIHMREATKDCLDILKEHAKTKVIFHCFSGSKETMNECLKMGAYISFAGPITFKNNRQGVECATLCPLDRILTETDSPYLTPVPYRGKTNEPKYVEFTTKKICELKEIDVETLCTQISNNFQSLFKEA